MTDDELQSFRELLTRRRDELIAEGDVEIEKVKDDPADKVDEDAAPLTEMNQVIASRRNQNRAVELQRIEAALRRIADDPEDFGYCSDCDEEIQLKRLELMPWAPYCVRCQEKRSPRRGGRRRHAADYLE